MGRNTSKLHLCDNVGKMWGYYCHCPSTPTLPTPSPFVTNNRGLDCVYLSLDAVTSLL